ncbi:MAG: hypothetical protein ACJAT7_003398, partial [Psychromonas sp.]
PVISEPLAWLAYFVIGIAVSMTLTVAIKMMRKGTVGIKMIKKEKKAQAV